MLNTVLMTKMMHNNYQFFDKSWKILFNYNEVWPPSPPEYLPKVKVQIIHMDLDSILIWNINKSVSDPDPDPDPDGAV